MDLPVQRFIRPSTLAEAVAALAEHPHARPFAGGTDLMVQLRGGRRNAETVVDLGRLELSGLREQDGGLVIGACTTMHAVARNLVVRSRFPALAHAAEHVGAWPIQCRATLGGNLANASPAADTAPPLLTAGASVELLSISGSRMLPLEQFFLGPGRTAAAPEELLVAVHLPAPPEGLVVDRFVKVGPRQEQVISMVSLAGRAVVRDDGVLAQVRVALGAVAPTPLRATSVEALLSGRVPDDGLRREAVAALQRDIAPIDDVRAPASYRRIAAAVLLDRWMSELASAGKEVSRG